MVVEKCGPAQAGQAGIVACRKWTKQQNTGRHGEACVARCTGCMGRAEV